MSVKSVYAVIFGAAILFCYSAVSAMSFDDQKLLNDDYCYMVSIWQQDAKSGKQPSERAGHPNYKNIHCGL